MMMMCEGLMDSLKSVWYKMIDVDRQDLIRWSIKKSSKKLTQLDFQIQKDENK